MALQIVKVIKVVEVKVMATIVRIAALVGLSRANSRLFQEVVYINWLMTFPIVVPNRLIRVFHALIATPAQNLSTLSEATFFFVTI